MVALVIGHSIKDKGAYNSTYNISEFIFNEALVKEVSTQLDSRYIDNVIIYRRTLQELPNDINEYDPSFVISFHCNAFNKVATGSEVLYWHNSDNSEILAKILQTELVDIFGLTDRGIKTIYDDDRGAFLLKYVKAPCVILEPFFIDNDNDYSYALEKYDKLVEAIVNGISSYAEINK